MSHQLGQREAQGGHDCSPAKTLAGSASIGARKGDGDADTPADVCRRIDELLERLARHAASDLPPGQFLDQLLAQAIREAGAFGGAIWAGRECLLERSSEGRVAPAAVATRNAAHLEFVERIIGRGSSDSAIVEENNADGSTSRLICVVAPFSIDQQAKGAIELRLAMVSRPSARDHARKLAEAFAEVIGDYYTRRAISSYRQREVHWQALSRFLEAIHIPGLRETAIAIANEGRWFSQCDRVSVVCRQKATCQVWAVSGVDRVEPRSSLVRRLEELADAVLETNEELWEIGESAPRAKEIDQPLHCYLEQSHSRALVAIPLNSRASGDPPGERLPAADEHDPFPLGVIVLEWFTPPVIDEAARERIEIIARHGGNALSVATATERLPLIAFNRAIAKVAWLARARRLSKARWVAGVIAAMLLALVMVPADFEISADGELQPLARREVFAPSDAVVDSVLIEHGDAVAAGQPLLRLRSAALDFESARLRGEIQTAEKRMAAIRSARFERDSQQPAADQRRLALSAEEEELKASLASLRRQEQLLNQERAMLEVRSPLDGQVLTWDVARSLAARPVERGQSLLSVGKVQGQWSLELAVPDEQIGYVLAAAEQVHGDGAPLPVRFLLAAEPGVTYRGYVERIARRGHVDERSGKTVVQVVARLDRAIENPRPGAGVVAKIDCGRRSLGFVWLHDAWNSVRRHLLF